MENPSKSQLNLFLIGKIKYYSHSKSLSSSHTWNRSKEVIQLKFVNKIPRKTRKKSFMKKWTKYQS